MNASPVGVVATQGAILYTPRVSQSSPALKVLLGAGATTAVVALGAVVTPAEAATAPVSSAQTTAAAVSTATVATQAVKAAKVSQKTRAARAVRYAYQQVGDPYRYGGTGPRFWDCSGLAGGAWRKAGGVKLPRTTTQIYRSVRKKVSYKNLKAGDLVFFYSGKSHMGIYVGKGAMIHSPSSGKKVHRVRLKGYYSRVFTGAVRPGA